MQAASPLQTLSLHGSDILAAPRGVQVLHFRPQGQRPIGVGRRRDPRDGIWRQMHLLHI